MGIGVESTICQETLGVGNGERTTKYGVGVGVGSGVGVGDGEGVAVGEGVRVGVGVRGK